MAAAPQEPAWRQLWMSPLCSRSAGASLSMNEAAVRIVCWCVRVLAVSENESHAELSLAWSAEPVRSGSKGGDSGGIAGIEHSGGRIDCRRRLAENAVAIAAESLVGCARQVVAFDRKHEACTLARPELLQQPHVPIEETGQTRGIAWHQMAVNDRTVLVLIPIVTQIRADDIPSGHACTSHQQSA